MLLSLPTLCALAAAVAAAGNEFNVAFGERQLFLDDHGIAKIENLTRTMHQPAKKGAVIRPNPQIGESCLQTRSAPAWDPKEKIFKLWMIGNYYGGGGTTYAESKDGLHWTKPALRQYEINGSKENNIVALDPKLKWPDSAMENVVYDPDEKDPSRRYKGFANAFGREPIVSPDGRRWKRLDVPKIPSSDESNMSYDRGAHMFIATLKTQKGPHGRSVKLSTSRDFEHWTEPELIFHADDLDQELGRKNIERVYSNPLLAHPVYNNPAQYNIDVYNMGVFRYEGVYIGMPSMFHKTGLVAGDWPGFADWNVPPGRMSDLRRYGDWSGFHLVELACSRDLHHWERLGDRQPFIDLSPVGAGAYDVACIIGPSSPVVRDDELWFYYTGITQYGGAPFEGVNRDVGAICLAVLRRDGFISMDAGEDEGVLLTKPFKLPGGKLYVNIDAPKGELRVEALGEDGQRLAESLPLVGDLPRGEVRWELGDIAKLKGELVSLRFALRAARFYSYWLEN